METIYTLRNREITVLPEEITFCNDGKKVQYTIYRNGKKNGEYKTWYENGQLKFVNRYVDDKIDKIAIKYFKSGNVQGVSTYKNGLLNGHCILYFHNGNTYRQSIYENDKLNSFITYNETGKVVFDSSL